MNKECETCIKRKTMWCPTSMECMALDELPYHLDKISALKKIDDLQQENKQLKEDKKKAREYIDEYFEITEYGEYYFTHYFDESNMKRLYEILGDDKE